MRYPADDCSCLSCLYTLRKIAANASQLVVDNIADDAPRPKQIAKVTHQTNQWWKSIIHDPSLACGASRHRRFRGHGSIKKPYPNRMMAIAMRGRTTTTYFRGSTKNNTCGAPTVAPVVVSRRRRSSSSLCFEVDSQCLLLLYGSF